MLVMTKNKEFKINPMHLISDIVVPACTLKHFVRKQLGKPYDKDKEPLEYNYHNPKFSVEKMEEYLLASVDVVLNYIVQYSQHTQYYPDELKSLKSKKKKKSCWCCGKTKKTKKKPVTKKKKPKAAGKKGDEKKHKNGAKKNGKNGKNGKIKIQTEIIGDDKKNKKLLAR